MSPVTVTDLNNAKLDCDTIGAAATSSAPTVTDRLGNTKNTLSGMNAAVLASAAAVQGSIGYLPPVAYAAGISLTLAAQTVGYSGQTYAPILSALPFTTSGTFETAKFRLIQGVSGADLAAQTGAGLVGFSGALNYAAGTIGFILSDVCINVKLFPWLAKGDGIADDTAAIQAALNAVVAKGGGRLLIPKTTAFYKVTDTLTIGAGVNMEFDGEIKLTVASSIGTVLLAAGNNIRITNPLIDGGGAALDAGENGISIGSGKNIKVLGGKIKNCARGGTGGMFGGKGIQIEPGAVEGILIDGVQMSNCFMAMSTIRDGTVVAADYGIQFANITADNCEILFFVKQANINNTNGLQHTVQLNNFYAVNCGAFEGVMQFSRAANVQVSNGVIVNDPAVVNTPLIRGNHRFSKFDNIRFSGNCPSIIDLDPSTFAADSSYPCENNTYDINHSGVAGYVANANLATANRTLQDSKIVANLDSDVTNKIVGDELRNGYCELHLSHGGKTILTTTAAAYVEARTTFASYPAGISMPRFNSSQITFPAVPIPSANPNTLDEYKEGVWTPIDSSASGLVLTAYGDYIKVGRMVHASFRLVFPTTSNTANVVIGGLPFASANNSGRVTCGLALRYTDQGNTITGANQPGTSTFNLAIPTGAPLTNANMSGKILDGVLMYMAGE